MKWISSTVGSYMVQMADATSTLMARDYKDPQIIVGGGTEMCEIQNERKYVLRRLTPTECARLQGFPDWWCDGADGSDSAMYKMWGNGIALPCAADVIGRIVKEIRKDESVCDV